MKKQHDDDLVKLKEQELEEFRQQVDAIQEEDHNDGQGGDNTNDNKGANSEDQDGQENFYS